MTYKKKGDLIVETFIQHGRDGEPDVEVFRVHNIEGDSDYLRAGFEDYQEQKLERQSKGRYTLEEAAMQIVENTDADARTMLDKLIQAVRNHSLPVYGPNKHDLYKPERVREWYEEAYWEDLNAWLADNEKRINWRFPEPATLATEQAKSEAPEGSAGTDRPAGVTSVEIIKKFRLEEKWVSRLSHNNRHSKHLKDALLTAGRRGKGKGANLWNPAQFALMLMNHEKDNMTRLNTIMKGKFPEWLDQWCDISGWND